MAEKVIEHENFIVNFINLGKTKNGDFYVHMNGVNENVNNAVCYKKTALSLIVSIRKNYPHLSIPQYDQIEAGDKHSVKISDEKITITITSGSIKESKGKSVLYFNDYSLSETLENEDIQDVSSTIPDDFLPELEFSPEATFEERLELIKDYINSLKAKISQSVSLDETNEFEAENSDKEKVEEKNILNDKDLAKEANDEFQTDKPQSETSTNFDSSVEQLTAQNESQTDEEKFGENISFEVGSPEEYAMSKFNMGDSEGQKLDNEEHSLTDADSTSTPDEVQTPETTKETAANTTSETPPEDNVRKPISIGKPKISIGKPKLGNEKPITDNLGVSSEVNNEGTIQKDNSKSLSTDIKNESTADNDANETHAGVPSLDTEKSEPFKEASTKNNKPSISVKKPMIGKIKKPVLSPTPKM